MKQTKPTYKQQGNVWLFDSDETMERLNKMGNPLAKLQEAVDFEMFRETLEKGLYKEKFTKVGTKPYDYVLMFKIVVLSGYTISVTRRRNTKFVTGSRSATSSDWPAVTRCPTRKRYGLSRKN